LLAKEKKSDIEGRLRSASPFSIHPSIRWKRGCEKAVACIGMPARRIVFAFFFISCVYFDLCLQKGAIFFHQTVETTPTK